MLTGCAGNTLLGERPTTEVLPPVECAQGLFEPIFPTEQDWEVISPQLDQQLLDHNMNFE